jgi:hypothetical protein
MKGETKTAGFTIVETLIVLAVTSALFVSVMMLISGKQNKAQFQQSVRDIQTKVQQTINEVATGFYPNNNDFKCTKSIDAMGVTVPLITAGAVEQGKNTDCVFLGKMIQLSVNNTSPELYNIYSIAGLREATTFTETKAVVIDAPGVNVTQQYALSYGLQTKWMCYSVTATPCTATTGVHDNSFGFISRIGSLSNSENYEAGAVDLVAMGNLTTLSQPDTATVAIMSATHLTASQFNPAGGVSICFESGRGGETALLTIGANGHNLGVKLDIKAC